MTVSVIVPFHKGISFLEDCIESLKEQTYRDFEVILVCDRVEEDVASFIEPYKNELNISVHYLDEKSGVAAARNLGISMASGEYIYFLDSDDYLDSRALEYLVTVAKEKELDIAYGKKVWTWFTRNVYMANQAEDESELEIENETENETEDDEETSTSSSDIGEADLESGGEDERESSIDDDQLMSDDSVEDDTEDETDDLDSSDDDANLTEEERLAKEMERIAKKQRRAYYQLVSRRKGVRSITVLHLMIKSSLIKENKLEFKEDICFLSDYPFVLRLLSLAERFDYVREALYVKRNHNDPINYPSLGQTKGSKSFTEYVYAYEYAKTQIEADSDLRKRLDKKIIHYSVRYFAPKLRRSTKIELRDKQYEIIHRLISQMDIDLLRSYKKYKRKLLKSFYRGNIKKSIAIVNRHLAWKKFKKITKNKRALAKYLYRRFFIRMSLKENWVFCESFFGKNYSDSPKYIYQYLSENYKGKYKFIWVIDKKNTKIPYRHIKVKRFSIPYMYYLARSKYYIFNSRQPVWTVKRKGNVFLQTWHGTPLKRLVFDIEDISSATPKYKKQVYKQSRAWDYLIAPNKYSSDIFHRCFMFDKVMLETGYPRNDILHDANRQIIADKIRNRLGIPKNKKTILYAPTWRDDEYYAKGQYKFTLQLDLHLMKQQLGSEYVVLLRTHYFIADSLDITGLEGFAYNVSNYDDISELYLISDMLITDYSSVFFDYANLKRPMLFFMYDLEKYRDILRGFYIDIEKELPGPILFTTEEIISSINNIKQIQEEYKDKYKKFYDRFCAWEDGQASRKVVEQVFDLKGLPKK